MCSLYLGNTLISGNVTTVEGSERIGQIVQSTIPLTDAGLHLLDGALIQGSGIYSAFVDYIADLYTDNPNASYFAQTGGLPWTQPILSANGTLGGSSFAVSASSEFNSSWQAYMAFDGNYTSSGWVTRGVQNPSWITFYNPVALNVTSLTFTNRHGGSNASEVFTAGAIYGSNNNSDWTEIKTYTNSVTACLGTWTVNLSNNSNYYKYYKITGTSFTGTNNGFDNIAITATQQASSPEEWWQSQVIQYGVCGKFVYDSTNNTVRLPKVTGIIEGTTDVSALGDLVEAGLPNHQHSPIYVGGSNCDLGDPGQYVLTAGSESNGTRQNTGSRTGDVSNNSIYGNSSTVQPQTIKAFYYIVIATTTKTDIQVDIDEIATDLNGKADVDLSNVPASKGILTESYLNGASWYRVYSDGWCEQGGVSLPTSSISFLKPYRDTSYTLTGIILENSESTSNDYNCIKTKNTGSFAWGSNNSTYIKEINWQACGYIR